ncbi:MAG: GNAT family N-acetyltransferase [Rhodobacteraceae bacterium]|nr:GNAT family N-acetyltransferase [Paracoccaceae bacterium]MCP5342605.1 GNAT family N-acetyltransferase [Paracoccaceae bacterium]
MAFAIRDIIAQDRPEWERLYQGYAEFYKVAQTPAMRQTVWRWINDPGHECRGLVAAAPGGHLLGLVHFRPFARPLSATVGGFLDDLFVEPGARGTGAADALIAAVRSEGQQRGWSVIRWITADDNARARRVYDRMAAQTNWVTYDLKV